MDKEPTLTVEDTSSDGRDVAADKTTDPPPAFAYDEQTLGRSASVFDSAVELIPPVPPPVVPGPGPVDAAPAPRLSPRERRRRIRLEARRVRRIVRHIEPWSVLKISVIFYLCLWMIFVLAGVLLWSFAESSGTLESIEDLIEELFALDPDKDFWSGSTIFRAYAIGTLVLTIAGIAFNVLLCVMYNLISDLTGGIRLTVIEEESARFRPPRRRQQ